ncbi:uncharacterized protein RJT21DRAFT_23123 [Scheffersomyces amazonensis]|uniref:uncharacterized protein n=1 Tax=Scheffersomyces amazonensis TaxID=1078765 RepID=UPI00315CA9F5
MSMDRTLNNFTDSNSTFKTNNISETILDLGLTPYPALALGSSLLFRGLTHKPKIAPPSQQVYKKVAQAIARPTPKTCFSFGAINLLGAWLVYDGDEINGAEFNCVWSSIYLLINGKSSITSLIRGGNVTPAGISSLALFSTVIYGQSIISSWRGLKNESRFYD